MTEFQKRELVDYCTAGGDLHLTGYYPVDEQVFRMKLHGQHENRLPGLLHRNEQPDF